MNQEKASREQGIEVENSFVRIYFLIFSFYSALKAEYDRCVAEKDSQYENMRADLETKLNQAKEEHENQVEGLISEHEAQINENRRAHDEAVQNLERQKGALIEGN
jgi:Skp family chaperone for outer membrane proteins